MPHETVNNNVYLYLDKNNTTLCNVKIRLFLFQ